MKNSHDRNMPHKDYFPACYFKSWQIYEIIKMILQIIRFEQLQINFEIYAGQTNTADNVHKLKRFYRKIFQKATRL